MSRLISIILVAVVICGVEGVAQKPAPQKPKAPLQKPDRSVPPEIQKGVRTKLDRVATPRQLDEIRHASLPATITALELVDGKCASGGVILRIRGLGFGPSQGLREVKIIRRVELGTLRVGSWSNGEITARIPASIPARSFYEIGITDGTGRWITNLKTIDGCVRDVVITPSGAPAASAPVVDTLLALFPRDQCRTVDLDTLDITYTGTGGHRIEELVDRDGTVVSFSNVYPDEAFLYILDHWLTTVCFGPKLGNDGHRKPYRMMLWLDRDGRVPGTADAPEVVSECVFCPESSRSRR